MAVGIDIRRFDCRVKGEQGIRSSGRLNIAVPLFSLSFKQLLNHTRSTFESPITSRPPRSVINPKLSPRMSPPPNVRPRPHLIDSAPRCRHASQKMQGLHIHPCHERDSTPRATKHHRAPETRVLDFHNSENFCTAGSTGEEMRPLH